MTWSSALLTQAFSGTSPSCVACMRSVSLVARLTWLTKAEAGAENAWQMTRASRSSQGAFCRPVDAAFSQPKQTNAAFDRTLRFAGASSQSFATIRLKKGSRLLKAMSEGSHAKVCTKSSAVFAEPACRRDRSNPQS